MILNAIPFPAVDPVLLQVGPFAVRWYALAYISGIIIGWRYLIWLCERTGSEISVRDIDDFVVWATLGVVLGGRIGYVLFYKPLYFISNPAEIFFVWQGGMSFHGGMLGVIIAIILFCRQRAIPVFLFGDLIALVVPVGLLLGRIANFINSELWGRAADVPWAMVFPNGGPLPRHPSQLYEATLEGLLLLIVLYLLRFRLTGSEKPGFMTGAFLSGYGIARIVGEFFREPDAHIGYLAMGATWGQILSVPMVIVGGYLIYRARRTP